MRNRFEPKGLYLSCIHESFAFNNNVDLTAIKQHGNWRSEAVWLYLSSTLKDASTIPTTFQKRLS